MGEYEQWIGPLLDVPAGERSWEDEQEWERQWWGDCANTYGEETKQLTYAHRMGFGIVPWAGKWPVYDMQGRSVVDVGGGPVSILLKCVNLGIAGVADPCRYPDWVGFRYAARGIHLFEAAGEDLPSHDMDEVWIYNVLQHVRDPELVVANARKAGRTLRIFDWLETPASPGHPHTLTEHDLNTWIGGRGSVEQMNENGCVGLAYYGVFPKED
jgi:hypothetical protein